MNKNERINEAEAVAMLETAQELLTNTKEQLEDTQSQLNAKQQQLDDTDLKLISLELTRHIHNIGAVIGKIDEAALKVLKGGGAE